MRMCLFFHKKANFLASHSYHANSLLYTTWLTFLIRYRKTLLGPAWLLVSPALFIAMLTVSFQSIRAASTNPVDSLKYE